MPEEEKKENKKIYEQKRYFALALDPIHVGTGGYRIGRVDNTIVREPATGIPKIPGTTIEGVCRSYAYLKAREDGKNIKLECAKGKVKKEGDTIKEPCGECEICITFGYTKEREAMQAMALFSDARILFFPVVTMIGPVWVTCPMVLRDAGIKDVQEPDNEKFITTLDVPENKLNFGWLLLEKDTTKSINTQLWNLPNIHVNILERIVIVPDNLFSTIVNSNLEVRTSIAIDPVTGAVEEGALFTYEAIPRGTVFWFDVTYQNPKYFGLTDWDIPLIMKTVEDGLKYFEFLGVGGMGSRGFGRLKIIGEILSFEDYLNALERRLEILKKEGKTDKIKGICDYLEKLKSEIENEIKNMQNVVSSISKIIS